MPVEQVLVLAMTRMRSGICTAGFTTQPNAITGLRWVRPVNETTASPPSAPASLGRPTSGATLLLAPTSSACRL